MALHRGSTAWRTRIERIKERACSGTGRRAANAVVLSGVNARIELLKHLIVAREQRAVEHFRVAQIDLWLQGVGIWHPACNHRGVQIHSAGPDCGENILHQPPQESLNSQILIAAPGLVIHRAFFWLVEFLHLVSPRAHFCANRRRVERTPQRIFTYRETAPIAELTCERATAGRGCGRTHRDCYPSQFRAQSLAQLPAG
jgi:hypothetical protein